MTDVVPLPDVSVAVGALLVAVLVGATALVPGTGRVGALVHSVNALGTLAHEAGHAAAACLTGGGVYVIEVHSPDSGVTRTWFRSWWSDVVTTIAGYAAPPLLGLGAATLISRGHTPLVLAMTVAAAVLVLLVTRDLLTLAVVVVVGGGCFAALRWGSLPAQHWVAHVEAWLLLLSEIPGLAALLHNRWHGVGSGHDDADELAASTRVPGVVWIAAWYVLIGWALWTAAPLLWS